MLKLVGRLSAGLLVRRHRQRTPAPRRWSCGARAQRRPIPMLQWPGPAGSREEPSITASSPRVRRVGPAHRRTRGRGPPTARPSPKALLPRLLRSNRLVTAPDRLPTCFCSRVLGSEKRLSLRDTGGYWWCSWNQVGSAKRTLTKTQREPGGALKQ